MILDEGDLNVQSSTRCEGKLEKEWYELVESEVCAAGASTFLASCFQEVCLTATINALVLTSDSPVQVLTLPLPPTRAETQTRQQELETARRSSTPWNTPTAGLSD